MTKIRCVIADDEKYALRVLEEYISKVDGIEIVAQCRDGFDVINTLQNNEVDLLFLDIQMPQITGLELLKKIKHPSFIILTTAYQQYALEAFELEVFDYLLKPFSFERFLKPVERIIHRRNVSKTTISEIFVIIDRVKTRILTDDIQFLHAEGNYVKIHVSGRFYMVLTSLKGIKNLLPDLEFTQVHKSYIVSNKKVETIKATSLKIGTAEIPVGRLYKDKAFSIAQMSH